MRRPGCTCSIRAAYVESLLACMLARLVPVNINYRYTGNELAHLFTAGRLAGLVVDAEHAPLAAAVAAGSPDLRHVLVTGSGTLAASFPVGITAVDYDTAIAAARPVLPDSGRSGDDKLIIFTGGDHRPAQECCGDTRTLVLHAGGPQPGWRVASHRRRGQACLAAAWGPCAEGPSSGTNGPGGRSAYGRILAIPWRRHRRGQVSIYPPADVSEF